MMLGKRFKQLKDIFDAYKMVAFILALVTTNVMQAGVQEYVRSEPVVTEPLPIVKKSVEKPTIIYKTDKEYCKKLIETELLKHYDSSRH